MVEGGTTPAAEWKTGAARWELTWNTDRRRLSIWYSSPWGYGGVMDQETLERIAESMK